jgi:hypothetical protein
MATFLIRRNHPYAGVITLCKLPGGSFVAKEMVVGEAQFIAAVVTYMKRLSPAEKSKLRRAAPPETVTAPPGNGEHKSFKVRRAATASAS